MVLLHLHNLFLHLGSSRFPLWPYLSDWSQTTTCGIQLSRWRDACIGFWKYFPYWTTKSDSGCNFFCSLTTKQSTNHSTEFNHSLSKIVYYLNLLYIVVLLTFESWVVSFQSLVTNIQHMAEAGRTSQATSRCRQLSRQGNRWTLGDPIAVEFNVYIYKYTVYIYIYR